MTEAQQRQAEAEHTRLRWHIAKRLDAGAPAGALIEAPRAALEGMRGGDTLAAIKEGSK